MAKISSVKNEIGITGLGDGTIIKANGTRVVFFEIEPSNLAVLSEWNIQNKIMSLANLMQSVGQIEMYALDNRENYSENRAFIRKRISEEKNPNIKKALMREEHFIKSIEAESSTARIFLLAFSIPKGMEAKGENQLTHFQQLANASLLNIRRLDLDDIKTILAVYFKGDTTTEKFENYDGENYFADVNFEELTSEINSGKYSDPIMSFDTRGYAKKEAKPEPVKKGKVRKHVQ